jgi:hypothetical protein
VSWTSQGASPAPTGEPWNTEAVASSAAAIMLQSWRESR